MTAEVEEEPAPPGRRRLRRELREELVRAELAREELVREEFSEEFEDDDDDQPELTGLVDRQVLTARRRLLIMLLLLTAGSGVLAGTKLAAWWVIIPPSVMLLGYLLLLREAAKADTERRELILSRAAHAARAEARAFLRGWAIRATARWFEGGQTERPWEALSGSTEIANARSCSSYGGRGSSSGQPSEVQRSGEN